MLRTATRPRWLGLLVLALLVAGAAVYAGRWQWSVAHDRAREDTVKAIQARPVEALDAVLAPHQGFPDDGSGQRVRARGHYLPDDGFVVVDRLLEGRAGGWAVERFVVEGSGANLPVVRGWLPQGHTPPPPPAGTVELLGSLAPGEAPDTRLDLPPGQAGSIDLAAVVNRWPGELYTGFAFVLEERAGTQDITAADLAQGGLERVPPPLPDTSLDLRNASYALQWWVVAGFVLWMWWRMLRQEARASLSGAGPPAPAAPPNPPNPHNPDSPTGA